MKAGVGGGPPGEVVGGRRGRGRGGRRATWLLKSRFHVRSVELPVELPGWIDFTHTTGRHTPLCVANQIKFQSTARTVCPAEDAGIRLRLTSPFCACVCFLLANSNVQASRVGTMGRPSQ